MPLILPGNVASATADAGYTVDNSCRFNTTSSDDLVFTQSGGNRKTFTLSFWVKKSTLGAGQMICVAQNAGHYCYFYFHTDDTLHYYDIDGATQTIDYRTNRVFRDVSAWYHIVFRVDTTQSTAGDRIRFYINGVQETSFSLSLTPSQDTDLEMNVSGHTFRFGNYNSSSSWFGGYLAECVFIDGLSLAPTSFGEFDEDSPTIWKPKDVSGLTFGTNGFYLDFEASDNLGNDANGGTDLTESNLAAADQATDTPTNNFATLNPLAPANISSASEGNLKIVQSSSGGSAISTIGFGSGKWYWEIEIDSQVTYTQLAGVIKESQMEAALLTSFNVGANSGGWSYFLQSNTDNGKAFHNNSASSVYTTVSDGDILSIAVDADNGKIYFGVNGTWVNSGDPAAGSNEVYSGLPTDEIIFPAITNYLGTGSGTPTMLMNFGNPPFSISSGNADADGYGNFEYAVPSGYYALCTKNLAEYG